MTSIAEWLTQIGLQQYAEVLIRNEVDLDVLSELSESELAELGIPLGARKRILKTIAASRQPPAGVVTPSYTPQHLAKSVLASRAAVEGERKRLTVLFCDIVGSSAMAHRLGEERMHALLNRFFELAMAQVHRYEGTINQFLGDGFMALFGAPIAHEDHAVRAVFAALDIQRALSEAGDSFQGLLVRMGVNTGLVVVGKIGDSLRMDYTAVGDTTNLAARLQQQAQPGTIRISDSTVRMCAGYVRTEALPVLTLGQGSEPIRSFTVSGRGTRKSPLEGRAGRSLTRFVGREREISVLVDILPEVEAGRGQVVGFVGEPGVGKSRLLYELRNRVQERNFRYLEARCLSYGIAMPYLPILDMLRAICGISEEDRHDAIVSKVTALQGAAEVDTDHLLYLLLLLGVREGTEPLREMSPETVKARTFQAVIRLVLQQSGRQPLALAIEDLHWIDKTSEELLSSLSGSITGAPILMLTTYRPGYRPPWMDQSYATQLSLRPLSVEESRAVVESALPDRPISDEIARSIVRKGDGNPFFLEELARSVGEQAFEQLPDTVQGVLLARIDRLSEPAKRLLQTASVLGREASLRLLRAIHDQPASLESDLEELKRQEFVYERGEGRERLIVFKHVLTQEAAYDSLLSGRRMGLHEAAGAALERLYEDRLEDQYEQLAYHYACTANADKAFEYLVRANEKAIKADAPVEAKGYFQRAMALLDTLPESEPNRRRRLTLLAGQIVLFQNLFQMQEYYDLLARYEPIAKELGEAALLGPIVQQLGHCDWTFGRFERAHERFTEAAALLEATGNYTVAAQTYQIWMWNHLCRGNFDAVLALQERAEIAWAKQPNLRWYVYALCAAGLAYGYLGRFQEGIAVTLKALGVAERFNDAAQVSFAAWSVAQTYFAQGDLDRAMEYGEMGVEKAPTPAERAWAEGSLAAVRCRAGQLDEVIAVLAPLYEGLRAARFVPGERFAPYLGEAYLRIGDFERAREELARGLAVQERHGMRYEAALTRRLLGELALASNPRQIDPPWAEPLLKACLVAFEEMNAQPELKRTWEVIGRLRAQQDR